MLLRRGSLADHFEGVAAKRLSAVETDPKRSNQHEFNGVGPCVGCLATMTGGRFRRGLYGWARSRKGSRRKARSAGMTPAARTPPERSRLYYPSNAVMNAMKAGDFFLVATLKDGSAMAIVAPGDSTIESQLRWLFGLEQQAGLEFAAREITTDTAAELDFAARYILDELGLELEEPEAARLDALIERFGLKFPDTLTLSELARSSLREIDPRDEPDAAILAWMDREEQLFRRLERRIVEARLKSGFMAGDAADIDGFLAFSLSVQNRRKSRAGLALENHLEALFKAHQLRFDRGKETENRNKPDFLFPGQAEYRDPLFPAARLTMLGAKST